MQLCTRNYINIQLNINVNYFLWRHICRAYGEHDIMITKSEMQKSWQILNICQRFLTGHLPYRCFWIWEFFNKTSYYVADYYCLYVVNPLKRAPAVTNTDFFLFLTIVRMMLSGVCTWRRWFTTRVASWWQPMTSYRWSTSTRNFHLQLSAATSTGSWR